MRKIVGKLIWFFLAPGGVPALDVFTLEWFQETLSWASIKNKLEKLDSQPIDSKDIFFKSSIGIPTISKPRAAISAASAKKRRKKVAHGKI